MLEHCPRGVHPRKPPTNHERAERWRSLFNTFRPREVADFRLFPRSINQAHTEKQR